MGGENLFTDQKMIEKKLQSVEMNFVPKVLGVKSIEKEMNEDIRK